MGAGNARNTKLLDLCLIEIGATVTLDIQALLCGIEFRSHRVGSRRVGHALFTQAIVVVDHGDGSAKGLSARSVDGNNVASAKT